MGFMGPSRLRDKLVDLLLILAGFAAAIFPYSVLLKGGLDLKDMLLASAISALTFWIAIQFHDAGSEGFIIALLERFCLGGGANLLVHALLAYGFFVRRIPFLIAMGSLLAAFLVSLRRYRISRRSEMDSRVLLIGFDAVTRKIASSMKRPVIGVIGGVIGPDMSGEMPPEGIPFLGTLDACEEIIRAQHPTHVVVGMSDWDSRISPSTLLKFRLAGTVVEDAPAVYERLFHRVSCRRLQPMDLLLSSSLRGDSRTMAIQAIYTNLIGLSFLIALSPILLLVSFAIALSSGGGPIFESVDCAGFRYIPFQRLRFRTLRTDGSGRTDHRLGRTITRLRLANLPQLINVVRGEMALVGPRAVRQDFAHFLTGLMPFYSHRFSVKPEHPGVGATPPRRARSALRRMHSGGIRSLLHQARLAVARRADCA